MNIITRIKEWIVKMLSRSDIKSIYGTRIAVTEKMTAAIEDWERMYCGKAPWTDQRKGIHSLRLEQAVVREFANTSINEMSVKVSNDKLNEILKSALKDLNKNLQRGLASGAMVIKPLGGNNVQYVSQSQFIPIEYDVNGKLVKVIFPEVKQIAQNDFRIRLEYHSLDYEKGLTITNKAFRSIDGVSVGREVPLSEVPEWSNLLSEVSYPLMLKPAFGYYVNPIDNTIDGTQAGVSIFESAKDLIRKTDIQFGRLDWEFESAERRLDVDEQAIREMQSGGAEISKLYRGVNIEDAFQEFSPALRQNDFIAGLEEYKREIEFAVGLSYGDISNPQTVDKTATEIKSSKQRKYDTVTAIQNNLRACLDDLCYSLAFYNGLTQSGYELSVNFEDSILTDDETKRTQDRQDVSRVVMPLWEYRMKWYGEDEETAKAMTMENNTDVIE